MTAQAVLLIDRLAFGGIAGKLLRRSLLDVLNGTGDPVHLHKDMLGIRRDHLDLPDELAVLVDTSNSCTRPGTFATAA
jgi:hypothetical protein